MPNQGSTSHPIQPTTVVAVRLPGTTLTAVLFLMFSALPLFFGLGAFWSVIQPPPADDLPAPGVVGIEIGCVGLALGVWCLITAIGLFRLRNWARWSTLLFSLLLTLVCVSLAVTDLMLPTILTTSVDGPSLTQVVLHQATFWMLTAVGTSWFVYFTRRRVRDQFLVTH